MKQSASVRKTVGFLFVSGAGTFLHFLYDITEKNTAAGLISAVNESIWEHMKLIFYPMLLFSLIEQRYSDVKPPVFRCSTMCGILLALGLIPVLYYTYTGILGTSADWFNITIFFLAAGAAYYLEYRLETGPTACHTSSVRWAFLLLLIAAIFTVTTFFPPRIPLFRDPLTGTYGIWSEP